ncbi:MAG: glucokinase [Acidiferrobacter sp.]
MTDLGSDLLLIGDIGGTKSDLLILSPTHGIRAPLARTRLKSAEYADLPEMLQRFLSTTGLTVKHACLDVAGPVVDGHAHLTNLPWEVDGARLRDQLDLQSVDILNDLAAIAHAIPTLQAPDLMTLNAGIEVATGTKAIIAPGTGLGEAFLIWNGHHYQPCPSEGGHADFAPPTQALEALLPYLRKRVEHVSYELVCSGIGIPYLYEFFRDSDLAEESPVFAAQLAAAADRTPLIISRALDPHVSCPLCRATLEAFIAILGAEAGNLALKVFALGGVYIAGGIPPRLVSVLNQGGLLATFCDKGRFAELLARIPVWLITNPEVALIGSAVYGLARMNAPDSVAGAP